MTGDLDSGGVAGGRSVVITGVGVTTASGIGREPFMAALRRGRSPVATITRFDTSPFQSKIGAEISGLDPLDWLERNQARRLDRYGQLSLITALQAVQDAELLVGDLEGERSAVQLGSALGGIAHAESQMEIFFSKGLRSVDPRLALTVFCGAGSCNVAIQFGIQGPNSTNAMSCASGTIAIGDAWGLIRRGVVDIALAGGVEAPLAPLTFGAFALIRAMSTRNEDPERACRPFDSERDGFVMGEGAAILVLEEEGRARRRGAPILARIAGYATSNDAHHMTAPRPDGSQAARAMTEALEIAQVKPEQVDYVNAHASSTPLNDPTESLAIRTALGSAADAVPISGTKPFYGHALGASGAIEAGICALALREQWVPPTLNLETPGVGCDLNHVRGTGRDLHLRHVLTNSFGFGGINAVLVLSHPDTRAPGA